MGAVDGNGVESDVALALEGDAEALERVLRAVEPMIFGLGMRMLKRREDAADATQEVLLRIATRLSAFRGESRFETWAYRIAANALLDAARSRASNRETSFEEIGARLDAGMLMYGALDVIPDTTTPEMRLLAKEMAMQCTQGMLFGLDAEHRLAYIVGEVFEVSSDEAAEILEITPANFRQRLARARGEMQEFMSDRCGLVSQRAACRCEKQVCGLSDAMRRNLAKRPLSTAPAAPLRDMRAKRALDDLSGLRSVAAVFRAHPEYLADPQLIGELRRQLNSSYLGSDAS